MYSYCLVRSELHNKKYVILVMFPNPAIGKSNVNVPYSVHLLIQTVPLNVFIPFR